MLQEKSVIVVGGGIAGLTASALLAHEQIPTILFESHYQPGGCAGTFQRGKYIFDVGATQVAGLEVGGIHERLFRHLKYPIPTARILDPACLVDLADGSDPIRLWHEPKKWQKERNIQFPGSQSFWSLCESLHKSNWEIASRDPVLPFRNGWDLLQLIKAIRLNNLPTGIFTLFSVTDLLKISGCDHDHRLKKFLDMQLKLYSQEKTERTAALYGATVLQMAQAPLGLWHLDGSMQKLSDYLLACFKRDGGKLLLNHRVVNMSFSLKKDLWEVKVINQNGKITNFQGADVVFTLPPQSLLNLIPEDSLMPNKYRRNLENLSKPSGAIVLYSAVNRNALPQGIPYHIQFASKEFGSIFISISIDGDGRAPKGEATLIASVFANVDDWSLLNLPDYQLKKSRSLELLLEEVSSYLNLSSKDWLHYELSTPQSFLRWTGRPEGIVGGLGQHPLNFGPFGLASRSPMKQLWLCGDSIYPGEGTAGVSQSALMACKQLLANRSGKQFILSS